MDCCSVLGQNEGFQFPFAARKDLKLCVRGKIRRNDCVLRLSKLLGKPNSYFIHNTGSKSDML